VAADLEAKLNRPRPDLWDSIDTPANAPNREVSCFCFFFVRFVSGCGYLSYVLHLTNHTLRTERLSQTRAASCGSWG
jgi:hypothetical protein